MPREAAQDQYFLLLGLWFRFDILGSLCASANVMLVYPQLLAYMSILGLAYVLRRIFGVRPGVGRGAYQQARVNAVLERQRTYP